MRRRVHSLSFSIFVAISLHIYPVYSTATDRQDTMAKTPNSNHDCLKGLMFVVCASAAVSALALSAYLFSEVESIARRLDEQAKTLSRLDTSTSTQAKAETPTVRILIGFIIHTEWFRNHLGRADITHFLRTPLQYRHRIVLSTTRSVYFSRLQLHRMAAVTVQKAS
jgi:hypothetical protein